MAHVGVRSGLQKGHLRALRPTLSNTGPAGAELGRGRAVGYLLVGPRPDGSIPSHDEQKAINGVSEDIARAIRTVIKREAREAEIAELIAENLRRIEALEAVLDGGATRKRGPRSA